jgi:Tfp pilus assembly protein PilF
VANSASSVASKKAWVCSKVDFRLYHATDLLTGLGQLHLKTNGRAKARALFLQVQAVEPTRFDVLSALANLMALDGEYAPATDLYRRVLALHPDDTVNHFNLGKFLLELGDRAAGEAT